MFVQFQTFIKINNNNNYTERLTAGPTSHVETCNKTILSDKKYSTHNKNIRELSIIKHSKNIAVLLLFEDSTIVFAE